MAPKRIDRDAQLNLELDYCVPRGIPHSVFLSWSQLDRNKALGWLLRELAACPNCRTRPEEWDPKQGGHRRAYIPEIRGCEGCIALGRGEDDPALKQSRGRRVVLVRNPKARKRRWRGR